MAGEEHHDSIINSDRILISEAKERPANSFRSGFFVQEQLNVLILKPVIAR